MGRLEGSFQPPDEDLSFQWTHSANPLPTVFLRSRNQPPKRSFINHSFSSGERRRGLAVYSIGDNRRVKVGSTGAAGRVWFQCCANGLQTGVRRATELYLRSSLICFRMICPDRCAQGPLSIWGFGRGSHPPTPPLPLPRHWVPSPPPLSVPGSAAVAGARVLAGGSIPTDAAGGQFYPPTVLCDVTDRMHIANEVEGPLALLRVYRLL